MVWHSNGIPDFIFKNIEFEKKADEKYNDKKHAKLPKMQRVKMLTCFYYHCENNE